MAKLIFSFMKGFFSTMLVFMLIIMITKGASPQEEIIITAPLIADAAVSCSWVSVGSDCNEDACYANKGTADKLCIDNGDEWATSYIYYNQKEITATRWTGVAWSATASNLAEDVAPKGGGTSWFYPGGSADTSTIIYIHCCS